MTDTYDQYEGERMKIEAMQGLEVSGVRFIHTMREKARQLAEVNGSVTIDDMRKYANEIGMKPESSHAWGAIFRGNNFIPLGWQTSEVVSNHSRAVRIWGLKK